MKFISSLTRKAKSLDMPAYKLTTGDPIKDLPLPEKVVLPLMVYGAEYKPVAKKGDKVLTGEEIARCENPAMPPFYATISGEVAGFIKYVDPIFDVIINSIVIKSDGNDQWAENIRPITLDASVEELLEQVRLAGISGLGGAGFPLYIKLKSACGCPVENLIINGMECEPYVTADYRLMLEEAAGIMNGIKVLQKIARPQNTVLAISDEYSGLIEPLKIAARESGIGESLSIKALTTIHPSGAEKILIKTITGKVVGPGKLPLDVGASVHNTGTIKAVSDAVFKGRSLVDRVITVTGKVKKRANLRVRIGTPVIDAIEYCGGLDDDTGRVVLGGPMTGKTAYSLDHPITARVICLLALNGHKRQESACIRCGRCIAACPVGLAPAELFRYSRAGKFEDCEKENIELCFDCGNCSFACPSGIPLVQYIRVAKREIMLRKVTA